MTPRELRSLAILSRIEAGGSVTQRSLARELGVALGLANAILRELVQRRWVQVTVRDSRRPIYSITRSGTHRRKQMMRAYLAESVGYYQDLRASIEARLRLLAREIEETGAEPSVVFYRAGEIAEVGSLVLPALRLRLIGIVDANPPPSFGIRVYPPEALQRDTLAGERYSRLVVMSFSRPRELRAELRQARIPASQVFWI